MSVLHDINIFVKTIYVGNKNPEKVINWKDLHNKVNFLKQHLNQVMADNFPLEILGQNYKFLSRDLFSHIF